MQWTSWPFRAQCPSAARPATPCRVTTTTSHSPSPLTASREAPHWRAGGAPHGLKRGEEQPRVHCATPHPSASPFAGGGLPASLCTLHRGLHCSPPSSTLSPVSKPLLLWGGAFGYAGLRADKASSPTQLLDLRSRIQLWVVPNLEGSPLCW